MSDDHEETTVAGSDAEPKDPGEKRPFLLVLAGNSLGRSRRLISKSCLIGRGSDTDFPLDDEGISRHHAKIVLLPEDVVMIKDLESTNGTFVNEQRIEVHPLENGDRIRLGSSAILRFSFEDEFEVNVRQHLFAAATRDALTGVYNKRAFDEHSVRLMAYARRHEQPLSLVMFDVDWFKKVNDTYGHTVGDEVLQKVARRVSDTIRVEDILARVGGEEFAVLLPGIDLKHAVLAAERLREVVCQSPMLSAKGGIDVSISSGAAQFDAMRHGKVADLVADCDALLYEAKSAGRNCVRPEPPQTRGRLRDQKTLVDGLELRQAMETAHKKGETP